MSVPFKLRDIVYKIANYNEDANPSQIAEILGEDESVISDIMLTRVDNIHKHSKNNEARDEIRRMMSEGKSFQDIIYALGVSTNLIEDAIKDDARVSKYGKPWTRVPASVTKIPISKLGLSNRAAKCLRRRGIDFIDQLDAFSDYDLLSIRNLGLTTLDEIKLKRAAYAKECV